MPEIAGVIAASPYTSAAPQRAMSTMRGCRRPSVLRRSANSARMPPSPLLSTRRAKVTYFSEVTMISVHRVSDSAPEDCRWFRSRSARHVKHGIQPYSGLVPMSPNTTPRAARLSTAMLGWAEAE